MWSHHRQVAALVPDEKLCVLIINAGLFSKQNEKYFIRDQCCQLADDGSPSQGRWRLSPCLSVRGQNGDGRGQKYMLTFSWVTEQTVLLMLKQKSTSMIFLTTMVSAMHSVSKAGVQMSAAKISS